jgi:hypothetical protein
MRTLRFARKIGVLLLAGAAFCYGQHGHAGGASSGHMGGPPSGAGSAAGNSGASGQGAQAGSAQSQKRSPEQLLDQNTKLASNLQKLLPEGMTAQQACGGFSNLGQCVAAIHVSHNLGISFTDLKTKMTGANPESLGKAIHELKPDTNANAEAKKAEKQAKSDMNGSAS